jgi:hypothetical protein
VGDIPLAWTTVHESFGIFDCIPPWIEWQGKQRGAFAKLDATRAGINTSVILLSACYVEGNLEHVLLRIAGDDEALRRRVSTTFGLAKYNDLFDEMAGARLTSLIKPAVWESVSVLFSFRNMLAHGRAVGYRIGFPPAVGGIWEDEIVGSYEKIEEYLLKKSLINTRHLEEANNWHYFSDEVADHFWSAARDLVSGLATL